MNLLNSRLVAVISGVFIAGITVAFLWFFGADISVQILAICAVVCFAATYLLLTLLLEYMFFREINHIYDMVDNLAGQQLSTTETRQGESRNPLRRIRQRIFRYATQTQEEINELKKLEAFRREFLADVSHELKTPIFAAQGFVHTLLDGAMEDKKVRKKFLKKAAKSLDGLDMLVHDLLTLSQMETGDIKMHMEVFSMSELAKEVAEQLEDKAKKKDMDLQVINMAGQAIVSADPRRIYQVLLNLVSNANKYCQDGAEIRIVLERTDYGTLRVSTSDNGPGIPEEHINRIFERFYRVEKSRSKDKGGTGLGLAIVKHVLEAHGQTVNVQSSPGEGTTFSFELPLYQDADPSTAANPLNEYA